MSSRGRGGKFQKPKRGGGKHYSRDLRPLNADGTQDNMWAEQDSNEEEDSDEDSSEESGDDSKPSGAASTQNMTREERKEAARARKAAAIAKSKAKSTTPGSLPSDDSGSGSSSEDDSDEEDDGDMPANPNHTAKAAKQALKAPAEDSAPRRVAKKEEEKDNLSRREREALQAQQAKERYQKLHAEGKTEEARADLARLALVKERREQEAARKKAEAEERDEEAKAKKEQLEREARKRDLAKAKIARGGKGKKGAVA